MAQFDVHRLGGGLVVDCQSNLLSHLNTRVVVPLMPIDVTPPPTRRLHPVFDIGDTRYVMATQLLQTVERRELGPIVNSFEDRYFEIIDALDLLISGI